MRFLTGRPVLVRSLVVAVLGVLSTGAPALAASGGPNRAGLVSDLLAGLSPGSATGSPSAPPPPPPPAPATTDTPDGCAATPVAGDTALTLTSSGLTRTAVLHLPHAAAGRGVPLIVAFHGYGSNGVRFAQDSGLSALGDQFGFAVVYPTSLGSQWALSKRDRDVTFTSDLLDRVSSQACIDHRRVYATGVSNGAGMAARVGCELSGRFAALVLVAGGYKSLPACEPDRPLSVLEIHGTSDTSVPYHGEGLGYDGAVLPYIAGWAARDHCGVTPTKRLVAAHTVLYRWSGCASGTVVEHLRIYGSGHGLPNAPGSEISSGNRSPISGVRNIWHFLAARTLGRPFRES